MVMKRLRSFYPPLEGEGRLALSEANARRSGVTVSAPDTAHKEGLSPHPAANFIRVDPPPPGEGELKHAYPGPNLNLSPSRYGPVRIYSWPFSPMKNNV